MDCAVTLCNTILINRVIRVIRALKSILFCGRKTQRSEQSCRKQRFLCPAIFCISPNAIKRCFSFISSCQCIRPSICNLYFKLISSFFQGTCNICTIRSSPDCATIYAIHTNSCQIINCSQIQINLLVFIRFIFPAESCFIGCCPRIITYLFVRFLAPVEEFFFV